ncbi:MAG: XylR family transcriptional regulator [Opitutaceae bacterium]|nr:XylR family transcriptional regulator [Opitutaceae bacterium]
MHAPHPKRILLVAPAAQGAFLRGVARFARSADWHLVTNVLHTGTFPRGWKGDGIIALLAYQPELASFIAGSGIPSVTVGLTDEYIPSARVEPDNVAIGRLAANHLLELAHRNFAWAPFINDRHNRERLFGFEAVLRGHLRSCEILPPLHRRIGPYWHDDWTNRRAGLVHRLKGLPRPTAVFAANDCVAAEVADACREAGLSVPDDIAILGAGNDPLECESAHVPLSSIDLNMDALACRAAELLAAMIEGKDHRGESIRVAPRGVVTRGSTGAGGSANPRIAHALACIAENYPDPQFSVASVASAVGLSRRQLERDFRQATGCTLRDIIERSRMNEASRLLKDHPRTKVSTIAELVGIAGAGNFFRTFRRHFGVTPTAYRSSHEESAGGNTRAHDTRATDFPTSVADRPAKQRDIA